MPLPDINVKVINGKSGYSRDNSSWVIGRIVRDFPTWMDPRVRSYLKELLEAKKIENIAKAEKRQPGSGCDVHLPERAGLCVSFYDAVESPRVGRAGRDLLYYSGFINRVSPARHCCHSTGHLERLEHTARDRCWHLAGIHLRDTAVMAQG